MLGTADPLEAGLVLDRTSDSRYATPVADGEARLLLKDLVELTSRVVMAVGGIQLSPIVEVTAPAPVVNVSPATAEPDGAVADALVALLELLTVMQSKVDALDVRDALTNEELRAKPIRVLAAFERDAQSPLPVTGRISVAGVTGFPAAFVESERLRTTEASSADIKRGITDYESRLDYVARTDTQPVYIGRALEGTATDVATWVIEKVTYDVTDRPTRKQVLTGAWDSRAALTW